MGHVWLKLSHKRGERFIARQPTQPERDDQIGEFSWIKCHIVGYRGYRVQTEIYRFLSVLLSFEYDKSPSEPHCPALPTRIAK
jgi:hypothetical protein